MAVKYQIFVSSTFVDLKEERDRVIQGILELGHIPVGMEMFSAGNDEQWKIIARHIEESDYYVVIAAHRYGSMVDGMSFTQKEYEYAVSRGVPVIGFVIDSGTAWPADRFETDAKAVSALASFKELIQTKPVGFWTSADDLYGKCTVALTKAFIMEPRVGWVRASTVLGPEVTAEISRLSAENAGLRTAVETAETDSDREEQLALADDRRTLADFSVTLSPRYRGSEAWEPGATTSLLRIFRIIVPVIQVEGTLSDVARILAIHGVPDDETRTPLTIALNSAGNILLDLASFDLVQPSARPHSLKDKSEYWSLTDRGAKLARELRRERIRKQLGAIELDDATLVQTPLREDEGGEAAS